MATNAQHLQFAIRAVNEATKALKDVSADIDGVGAAAERAEKLSGGFRGALADVAKVAGGFVIGQGLLRAPGVLMGMTSTARDLELQAKKVATVFGEDLAGDMKDWADQSAAAMGLSSNQAMALGANLQDLLVPMGFTRDAAFDITTKTLGLAGALAEWSGGAKSAAEVSDILTAAYLGETDGLKALGISISAADVQSRLAAKGQKDLTGAALEQAQALAVQELIFEKSTDAQNAFANGADSAARKQALMAAKVQEAKERLAQGLAPAIALVTTKLSEIVPVAVEFATELGERASRQVVPALQALGAAAGVVATWFQETLVPAIRDFIATDIVPKLETARDMFMEIGPAVAALATEVGERLKPPLMAVVNFVAEHKEIWAAAAIVIGGALVGAFTAWAVAAGAAALATIAALAPVIAIGLALTALVAGIIWVVKNWDELTAKYPALGAASDAIKAKFDAFTGWITGTFVPAVQAIYTGVKDAVDKAIAFVRDHWDEIRAIIEPALEALVIIIETQWKLFQTVIETALGVIKGVVDVFMGIFTGDWERAWGGVKQVVESVWDGIRQTIETVIGAIKDLAPLIEDAGKALGKALLDGLKAALSATAGFAGDVAGAVLAAVKEIINTQVIDRINRTLEFSFDTKIPGIGTIHIDPIDIPHLASGGIVTRPTLALIGEAGPEAVVPLSGPNARGGVGTTVNITVQGSVWSLDELMYELQRRGVAV